MRKRELVHSSPEKTVVIHGYLRERTIADEEAAIQKWQQCFVPEPTGEATFDYNRAVFMRNINAVPYVRSLIGQVSQMYDLPIFHAGVAFMNYEEPVRFYLFENLEDMERVVRQHHPDTFVLQNGEKYPEAAKNAGIILRCYDPQEPAEYQPDSTTIASLRKCRGSHDTELTAKTAEEMAQYHQGTLLSLPGWPSEKIRQSFYDCPWQVMDGEISIFPEKLRPYIEQFCETYNIRGPHVMYKIPLPYVDFMVHHIAVGFRYKEDRNVVLLIQNDQMFNYKV